MTTPMCKPSHTDCLAKTGDSQDLAADRGVRLGSPRLALWRGPAGDVEEAARFAEPRLNVGGRHRLVRDARRVPGVQVAAGVARGRRPKRRVNSPRFDVRTALYYVVGLDLTEIEGISDLTALTVISEIGRGGRGLRR